MDKQDKANLGLEFSEKTQEAMAEISRGCSEFIGSEYIASLVEKFYQSKERFIVKAGFDPTAPDLHLGHTVLIQKLATFQKYGGGGEVFLREFFPTTGEPLWEKKNKKKNKKKKKKKKKVIH
ncbi:hypothetical protein BKH42_07210 [Helicobacter sp. 13S00482-2]|uniref:hypothetical protein n=1 Tax=Helicobacter sp. 13S00482-2 TaxID=1476200 RepID=UPI000BDC3BFE|nr:hypothetical protein [Helicobacter sp. 13S00482-2]PAF53233.1 hypothetical protein BKH42_07210 [Helicobacter sp. 13S00482-2]